MPIDAYTLCPGGTGKKIKFCCPDCLPELEKIDRMLEGEQYLACLKHIETLEKKLGDRACLLSIKTMLLCQREQLDEARATVDRFLGLHPNNPNALAQSAMLTAVTKGGVEAMADLQRAIAAGGTNVSGHLLNAIDTVAEALLDQGQWISARALLALEVKVDRENRRALREVIRLNRSPGLPLLIREDRPLKPCPEDVAWKPQFDEALQLIDQARWAEAAEKLSALAEQAPDAPAIWNNLAVLRAWLADTSGCIDALRKFASLDVPRDDAVEAEALALCLAEDPLDDQIAMLALDYEVDDPDQLAAAMTLPPRVVALNLDPRDFADEDGPPPRAVYLLLDRDPPSDQQELTLENLPTVLAMARLFGRQTDRPARLEVIRLAEVDADAVTELLAPLVGQGLQGEPTRRNVFSLSASSHLLSRKPWVSRPIGRNQFQDLQKRKSEQIVLRAWPDVKMGLLGGRSLREAAADGPSIRLSAIVLFMELQSAVEGDRLDLNPCRTELGLPLPETIDPQHVSVASLPLVRLARLDLSKLTDNDLLEAMRRAIAFAVEDAQVHLAGELIQHDSLAGQQERLFAYRVLVDAERGSDKAIEYLNQGRSESDAAGHSCATWDLLELSLRFDRGEPEQAMQVLRHIEREHHQESGVQERLMRMLVEYGVLKPDGTPVDLPNVPPPSAAEVGAAADEPGKLWTPETQGTSGEKKLWTPGMD